MRRRRLVLAILCLSAAACALVAFQLWSTPRSIPGKSGDLTQPAVDVVWSFEPPERGAIVSSPLVTDDRVYIGIIHDVGFLPTGAVYCLDRANGKMRWISDDDEGMAQMASSPCLENGRLYIGEGMHQNHHSKLYCLDADTGRKLWHVATTSHVESSPCVADGKVFVGAGDDGVYGLDAVTGAKCWQLHGPYHVDASPTVVGSSLYIGSGISRTQKVTKLFCIDTDTGKVRWQKSTGLPVWGSPAVDGEEIFVGLGNGRLLDGPPPPEKPAGALLCVDRKSGMEHWRFSGCDAIFGRPALDADHVYVASRDSFCYCLDRRAGQECWRVNLGSPVVASPALCDGRLYAVSSAGRLGCLDARNGREIWTFELAAFTHTNPVVLSSPTVLRDTTAVGNHRLIFLGTELKNPVNSAAVLYCFRD